MQPRRLLLIEKSINLVSMSSHLTLRNKHRCISISSCYSTRVLTHSTFILPLHIILFVSYSSKHHCNSYCNQSLRVKRGRCLSTKSTLSWIAVCKRYRTIRERNDHCTSVYGGSSYAQFINSILDHLPGSLYAYVTVNMYNASRRKAEELIQQ